MPIFARIENSQIAELRDIAQPVHDALPADKRARWFPVVDASAPPSPPYLTSYAVRANDVLRSYAADTVAIANAAEDAADATRKADAASVLATLEANVNTDPANLTQASAQLRWIKRILLFLLKRTLR